MKLRDRVHLIASGFGGLGLTSAGDCNAYLVETSAGGVLIDAGCGANAALIGHEIRTAGYDVGDVVAIFVTHTHLDHIGGLADLAVRTGAGVIASRESADRLQRADEESTGIALSKRVGELEATFSLSRQDVSAVAEDEKAIDIGDVKVVPVATPGHASDHTSYMIELDGQALLFGGDFIFPGGKISLGSLPDCSLQAYLRTLERFRGRRIDCLFAGHRAPVLSEASAHFRLALEVIDGGGVPRDA